MPTPFQRRPGAQLRPSFSRDFAGLKTLDHGVGPAITFTRASNATFFDASGTLQTASNDAPRFDHSGGSSLGLLIEEARTNLLLNSATLATQTITVTAVAHTLSFYGTGEVVLSGAHSATVTGAGAFPTRTSLTFTPSAGSLTATVSGTVEYAQLEVGAFATSYITTTGATATRSADSAVVTPISSFYNQSEGSVFAEAVASLAPSGFPNLVSLSGTNVLLFSGSVARAGTNFGTSFNSVYGPTLTRGAVYRQAFAFMTNNAVGAANGSIGAETTPYTPAANLTSLRIGSTADGSNVFNSHIRKIAYYPKRLSNTLLQQLTT
jgi:hypothetical protein